MWISGFRCITGSKAKLRIISKQQPLPSWNNFLFHLLTLFLISLPFFPPSSSLHLSSPLFKNFFFFTRSFGCLGTHKGDPNSQRHSDFPPSLSYSKSGSGHQRKDVQVQKSCTLSPIWPLTYGAGLCRVSLWFSLAG